MREHPCGPLAGSLKMYDQLAARHDEAYANYIAATTEDAAKHWFREVEAAEMMMSYCPEHWARVEAIRIVREAQGVKR